MGANATASDISARTASTLEEQRKNLFSLPGKKLSRGQSIREVTSIEGIPTWWFADVLFRDVANYHAGGIALPWAVPGPKVSWLRRRLREGPLVAVAKALSGIATIALTRFLFRRVRESQTDDRKVLVIAQNGQWKDVLDSETGDSYTGDPFLHTVIAELASRPAFNLITTYPVSGAPFAWHNPFPGLRLAIDRVRRQRGATHRPTECYSSVRAIRMGLAARRNLVRTWQEITADPLLLQETSDRNPEMRALHDKMRYWFHNVLGRGIEEVEIARQMLRAERPAVVVMINEYGRFERAVVFAARLEGVPVLAVQHGVIHPAHWAYMLGSDLVSAPGEQLGDRCPVPELTAVYGEHERELLTGRGGYPVERVVVTGQPRYDIMYHAERLFDREKVLRGLGLEPGRKTVLWTTQTHALGEGERRQTIQAMSLAMETLTETQLVVKLHPAEDQSAAEIVSALGPRHALAGGAANTLALIHSSDLLITKDSTTGIEAVALQRPVVVLNLGGHPDTIEYVTEGVAVGVYNAGDLARSVGKLLGDDSELAANREKYIRTHLYRVDGQATRRVADLIENLARQGVGVGKHPTPGPGAA